MKHFFEDKLRKVGWIGLVAAVIGLIGASLLAEDDEPPEP